MPDRCSATSGPSASQRLSWRRSGWWASAAETRASAIWKRRSATRRASDAIRQASAQSRAHRDSTAAVCDTREAAFLAHRGGSALAPENTLPAYENGLRLGADALELDIHYSRDGEIVVFHDDTLDRTTNGSGPLAALTLADLRRLDAGYHFMPDGGKTFPWRGKGVTIPTLREVFERFPQTRVNIEMKVNDAEGERRLARLLTENGWGDWALVSSFTPMRCSGFARYK